MKVKECSRDCRLSRVPVTISADLYTHETQSTTVCGRSGSVVARGGFVLTHRDVGGRPRRRRDAGAV